jgi:hypothetical protein
MSPAWCILIPNLPGSATLVPRSSYEGKASAFSITRAEIISRVWPGCGWWPRKASEPSVILRGSLRSHLRMTVGLRARSVVTLRCRPKADREGGRRSYPNQSSTHDGDSDPRRPATRARGFWDRCRRRAFRAPWSVLMSVALSLLGSCVYEQEGPPGAFRAVRGESAGRQYRHQSGTLMAARRRRPSPSPNPTSWRSQGDGPRAPRRQCVRGTPRHGLCDRLDGTARGATLGICAIGPLPRCSRPPN